jgi:hypothetical protein
MDVLWVANVTTLHADKVHVGARVVPIIAIAVVGKPQLKHFAHFFKRGNGFVNCGQAGGGELRLDLVEYVLGTGMTGTRMTGTGSQYPKDSETLRSDAVVLVSQLLD